MERNPHIVAPPKEKIEGRKDIQQTQWKAQLAETIKNIEAFGEFASHKTYTRFVNPGIEVAGISIPLPLPELYADQIKGIARPAPFGRGDETVVDYSVRLTWELDHDEIRITNPSWKGFLDNLTEDAANGLGLKPDEVRIEPYKLLLYEKGSFFKPHKDSEKTPGMIGSMVVCLPSQHEGGAVHLSHAGKKSVFATAPSSAFDLTALAWYSDVTHEVKEVTSGHRLALTYNIVQTTGPGKSAGFFVQRQTQLRELIAQWPRDFSSVSKLVVFTDHKYTPNSLSVSNLMKGRDRAVFESLRSLCVETGMYIFLANVQKTEYEDYGDDYPYEDVDEENVTAVFLDCLCTTEGKTVSERIKITEDAILGTDPYMGRIPDETEEGEFTGNESQPSLFRYHNSAFVLVPSASLHQLMQGPNDMKLILLVMEDYKKNPKDLDVRNHTIDFMKNALDLKHPHARISGGDHVDSLRSVAMTIAWKTGDDELYRKVIKSYTVSGHVPDELVHKLASLLQKGGSAPRDSEWTKRQVYRSCVETPTPAQTLSLTWAFTRWWEIFRAPVNLTSLFAAVDKFEGLLEQDETKASFRAWANSSKTRIFESRPSFIPADFDGLIALATSMWNEGDWVSEQLLPKLQECQNRALVSKIIEALADKDRANIMPGSVGIAKALLNSQLNRVRLESLDFWSKERTSLKSKIDVDEGNRFLGLVQACLANGWAQEVSELFRLSNDHLKQHGSTPQPQTLVYTHDVNVVHEFLDILAHILHEAQAPFMEPAQKLVEHILRTYIVHSPPAMPPKPEGWAFKPRSCSACYRYGQNGPCNLCLAVNQFLTDPHRQTAEFCDTQTNRRKMEQNLMRYPHLFVLSTDPNGRGGRNCQTLIVTKREGAEYAEAMAAYTQKLKAFEEKTEGFRSEAFRRILGDDMYGELVLLNRLPGSQAAGAVPDTVDGVKREAVAGMKREAEDDTVLPSATRHWRVWE